MKIFETERLIIKSLEQKDKDVFIELLSHPKIIEPIPQERFTEDQILEKFNDSLHLKKEDLGNKKYACGVFKKGDPKMIGLSLFLINDENEKELGYRFRVKHWGKGYGTETTKGMIDYYFKELNSTKVTADANIANIGSIKILSKFMNPVHDFFNKRDNCTDRRFEIDKNNWLKQNEKI